MTITPDRKTLEMIAAAHLLPPIPETGRNHSCKRGCWYLYPEKRKSTRGLKDKTGWKTCRKCKFWAQTQDHRCRCCNTQLATRAYPK